MVARPMAELAVINEKNARNLEELYLANKMISDLGHDFQHFGNLEVLWLNDNRYVLSLSLARSHMHIKQHAISTLLSELCRLRYLESLDDNFRLKELYAHNNNIASLQDS